MVSHDLYQSFERSVRVPHVFGLLGKLHLLFLAALVVFPPLLSAQWHATIGAQSADLGRQGLAFLPNEIWIHAGETIEWTNEDPSTAHTVTFGPEPQDLFDPSSNVTIDADGARHGVLKSPSESVHSGFIEAAPQDRTGLPQAPSGVTRFRVTFTEPGIYPYICSLHDVLGMKGTVFVLP